MQRNWGESGSPMPFSYASLGASQQAAYSEVCLLHHLGGFQPAHNLRGFFFVHILLRPNESSLPGLAEGCCNAAGRGGEK